MSDNEYIERQDAPEINKGATAKKPTSKKVKACAFTQILNGEFLTRDFVLDNLNFLLQLRFPLQVDFTCAQFCNNSAH